MKPIACLLFVCAGLFASGGCAPTVTEGDDGSPAEELSDEAFLDDVQERTFRWFWETTNPENGLVPDRWPTESFSSIAAVGFGLTAYGVGVERGYVTREEAAARTLTTLRFFWNAPQGPEPTGKAGHRGFFYHFLDMQTGERYRDVELSTIDTALLLMGALFAQQYFDADNPVEAEIRALADSLYLRAEWDKFNVGSPLITMAWYPEREYGEARYEGYDEAMFLYVLGLASPTHPVDPAAWEAFTSTYKWATFYDQPHVNFSPLFGHQYAHLWIDFRGIQDAYMREKGIDYFENSRRAVLSQRAYAIDNPQRWKDYGEDIWGLTASDGPAGVERQVDGEMRRFHTYWARGASAGDIRDDGTIAPTAVGGSVPFAPEVTIPALKAMRERYGDDLYGEYGFRDAFNPTFTFTDVPNLKGSVVPGKGWFDVDYLGIDQGPIICMIENYRTGMIWEKMRESPYIVTGLCRAGFTGGWLEGKCE